MLHTNIAVDTEYDENARTYALCARASFVIAKYTSLVDECLATGIPVLVHDSGPTWRDLTESALPHLPRSVWIQSFDHAREAIARTLAQGAGDPQRLNVPPSPWADGHVRSRVRALGERLLNESKVQE